MLLQSRLPARQLASVAGSIISNMLVFGNVCKLMTKSLHRALDRRQGWDSCVELVMLSDLLITKQFLGLFIPVV